MCNERVERGTTVLNKPTNSHVHNTKFDSRGVYKIIVFYCSRMSVAFALHGGNERKGCQFSGRG
jgi:hypothetical protein